MRLFYRGKDGGPQSTVWGYWLCEFKNLFSVVLLCFEDGSRDVYHEHAFDCISWVLSGKLEEHVLNSRWDGVPVGPSIIHAPSFRPVITRRKTLHQVTSRGRTWVLSFRGPWAKTWREYIPRENRFVTLSEGRKLVA